MWPETLFQRSKRWLVSQRLPHKFSQCSPLSAVVYYLSCELLRKYKSTWSRKNSTVSTWHCTCTVLQSLPNWTSVFFLGEPKPKGTITFRTSLDDNQTKMVQKRNQKASKSFYNECCYSETVQTFRTRNLDPPRKNTLNWTGTTKRRSEFGFGLLIQLTNPSPWVRTLLDNLFQNRLSGRDFDLGSIDGQVISGSADERLMGLRDLGLQTVPDGLFGSADPLFELSGLEWSRNLFICPWNRNLSIYAWEPWSPCAGRFPVVSSGYRLINFCENPWFHRVP